MIVMCQVRMSTALLMAPLNQSVNMLYQRIPEAKPHPLHARRTYGKGLIQSVYELGDSSGLVLTVGKYLTPARTDIDREGLRPDFRHMPSSDAAAAHLAACRAPPSV